MECTVAKAKDPLPKASLQNAVEGRQTTTESGRPTTLLVAKADPEQSTPPELKQTFIQFLLDIPPLEGVDLSRDPMSAREIEI